MQAGSTSTTEIFDFTRHAKEAADAYRLVRPSYERLVDVITHILSVSIPSATSVHSVDGRSKDIDSFANKAAKPSDEDKNAPKYPRPLEDITDMAGIRVIVFFPKDLKTINDSIDEQFDVTWKRDIGEERILQGRFGYQSIHYLIKLRPDRSELPEYKQCAGLIAEIQVRTILQHAWAEMEHDIQYKTTEQIPKAIERRFIALAGMLEIADREFQAIQDTDAELRTAVKTSLQDDLTKATLISQSQTDPSTAPEIKLAESVSAAADQTAPLFASTRSDGNNVRDLVAEGRYQDAISLYSEMILAQPNAHTLYLGRAKARFLAGDRTGALADVADAKRIVPEDISVLHLQQQIESGLVTPTNPIIAWQIATQGHDSLSAGKGELAFEYYSRAQQSGFSFAYSTFDKAMACALMKDANGATYFLDQLELRKGSAMEINMLALRAIIAVIGHGPAIASYKHLSERRAAIAEFDFSLSPLRYLEKGLMARDGIIAEGIKKIFRNLKDTPTPQ